MAKTEGSPDKICKTVHQYSKGTVSAGDMEKLQEIDYRYDRELNKFV